MLKHISFSIFSLIIILHLIGFHYTLKYVEAKEVWNLKSLLSKDAHKILLQKSFQEDVTKRYLNTMAASCDKK